MGGSYQNTDRTKAVLYGQAVNRQYIGTRQYAGRTHAGHRQQKDGTHVDYRPNTDSRQAGHS